MMSIRLGYTFVLLGTAFTVGVYNNCPARKSLIQPGRECQRPCLTDDDCRSRKKICLCDMDCGMSCIKKKHRCLELPNIPNGRVIHPLELGFGSSAKYECNPGYRLEGIQVRACQGDESWSGIEPRCVRDIYAEKPECPPPPVVPNAVHDGVPNQVSYPLQSVLVYECKPGYIIERDGVPRAWCVGKGDWVGPEMVCSPRSKEDPGCPRLKEIDNGYVDQAAVTDIGGIATYRCKPGFHLAGREIRRCGSNGRWEEAEPSCEKVTCGPPPVVENGQHDGNQDQFHFPSGAQLHYTCTHGFHAEGHARAMCMDTSWDGLTLTCQPRSCGFPGNVQNGRRSGFSFTYPHRVVYHCNEGYEMIGEDNRQCQANGEWSNDVPICKPVTCPTLYSPVYGLMNGSGNSYGTVLRFECDKKYKLFGSAERRCMGDRTWSGTTAKCEEVDCGWPGPFYNGYLIGTATTVGATIYFSCLTRTTYHGNAYQAVCKEDGQWSQSPPTCLGQCQIPTVRNATILKKKEGEYVDHGSELEYRCENGLVPRDTSLITCNNGSWTATPECIPAPCRRPPPHVRNGMRVYMGTHHMDKAKYRCFPGFRLDPAKMNTTYLTCTFGEWLGGVPQCEEFYCESPSTIENGAIFKLQTDMRFPFQPYIRTINHGTRLEFTCDPGYRIVGPGGATCVNGVWRPALDQPGTKCVEATHPPFRKLWKPISDDNNRK